MKTFLLVGVAAMLTIPAVAADLPTKKAPAPIPLPTLYDWTGFYFGGNIGGSWANSNYSTYIFNAPANDGAFVDGGSDHNSAFVGGGQIGYRYMFPQRFVVGVGANLDWNAGSSNNNASIANGNYYQSTSYSSGLGGRVVAQAGYAWGDFLPYVDGGWAWTSSTVTHWQQYGQVGGLNPNPLPVAEQASLYRSGWTIGGGLAYHVWQNWEVFVHYTYASYGTASTNYLSLQRSVESSLTTNAITVGANLKF